MNRIFIDDFLKDDSFINYLLKSSLGLGFLLLLINLLLPNYLAQPLFSSEVVVTKGFLFSAVFAVMAIIIEGHIVFNIYFTLPYVLISNWLKKRGGSDV